MNYIDSDAFLEMTSELNKYSVHFELSSSDGGVLTTADFNNLERKDLRNCSSLNICFEPEEISISDVKITKMLIHYDGITDSPQDYFGFTFEDYLDQGFKAMKLRFGWGPKDGAEGMNKNIELIKTVRSVVGDNVDLMADVYMGWTFEYAKRMMRLIDNENLRWLEEPVIADDIDGYADLKASCRTPISGGEHEYTLFGFRQLLEKKAIDVVQFDTNRVGGITQAHKISALAEAFQIPVIPHAGQVHNFHISMSSVNAPIVEYFPFWPVEIGNELFWYIFDGEPQAKNGFIELDENKHGLGIELSEKYLDNFDIYQ